jgi:glycosyltransferase domain-containing protein
MSRLSNLSIVIFTYQRQDYALRNMRFWSGRDVRVYVLDGSTRPIDKNKLSNLEPNVVYWHLPIPLLERLEAARGMVDTDYVAFLADDDWYVPSALEACLVELETHQDVVACAGRGVEKALASDLVVHHRVIQSARSNYRHGPCGDVGQNDPIERMISHLNPYVPSSFYSVSRSGPWKRTVQLISSRQYSSGLVAELQFELAMSFEGKIKILDELMWLRSAENQSHTAGFELEFDAWFKDENYAEEAEYFLDVTAHHLAEIGSVSDCGLVKDGLLRASQTYVEFCRQNERAGGGGVPTKQYSGTSLSKRMQAPIKKLISYLPDSLVAFAPQRLRFRPYIDLAKTLAVEGVKVDWTQLNLILETVRNFHDDKKNKLN